jgi:hypothetical protein
MIAEKDTNEKKHIQIHVPDFFCGIFIMELAKARGLKVWLNGGSGKKVHLFCTPHEADALLRDAKPAGKVLYLLALEAVGKALTVAGKKPSQEFLDLVAKERSKLGALAARV